MALQAYSLPGDMLLGGIPPDSVVNQEKYVQDAADEIDSRLGFTYVTPMVLTDAPRPVKLLMKRINNFLATGRYIMAVASPIEQQALHAYGRSLVENAEASLTQIAEGVILLEGVALVDESGAPEKVGPQIHNKDTESAVDAFYDRVVNPAYGVVFSSPYGGTGWMP